jgi:hypothetical protein
MLLFTLLPMRSGASENTRSKLIKWGWDAPTPDYVAANAAAMEAISNFDGIVIQFRYGRLSTGNNDGNFERHVFRSVPLDFNDSTLQAGIDAVKSAPFKKFKHNFARATMVHGYLGHVPIDWFDNWIPYLNNVRLAARVAKEAGLKGLILDTEAYNTSAAFWQYSRLKYAATKTFGEYQMQAKLRGRQMMDAMMAEYPDIVILFTFANGTVALRKKGSWSELHSHGLGLVPSVVDGMLEAINAQRLEGLPHPTLVDGFEPSYGYKTESLYMNQGLNHIKVGGRSLSSVPLLYDQFYKAGFGIWVDYASHANDCANRRAWSPSSFTCNHFSPSEIQNSVYLALKTADKEGYVWLWSERLNWWTGQNLPREYIDAIRAGKAKYDLETSPPAVSQPVPPPTPISTSPANPTPAPGLVGHWTFDETTGSSASDSSGNSNTGTLVNGPIRSAGYRGRALSFDGVNDYVTIPNSPSIQLTQDITLAGWIYPTMFNPPGYNSGIMYKGGKQYGCCLQPAYALGVSPHGYLIFSIGDNSTYFILYGPKLSLNTWTHVAAIRQGTSMKLYVNGVEVASTSTRLSGLVDSTAALMIGKSAGGWGGKLFNGKLDEVRVYQRGLTPSELRSLTTP